MKTTGGFLLHAVILHVRTHQSIEYGKDVAAVFHHAAEYVTQFRFAFGLAVPFRENHGRHFDIPAQFLGGMAAQEQTIEKRGFSLGKVEVVHNFRGNDLWQRSHREKGSVPKRFSTSSSTMGFLPPLVQPPFSTIKARYATGGLPAGSNRRRMIRDMSRLHNSVAGRAFGRFARFGLLRGLSSIEIDREEFRQHLKKKHGLDVPDFRHMHWVPVSRLDAIARTLIKDTERLALLEGAGFGLGGMITIIPDAGLLTILTIRLIQRLCLLYGFERNGQSERLELWMAAAAATGVDYGKDLAEKQILEKLGPRIAERLAVKLGQETAEKWVGRLIPLASSAIGGALNFTFVRAWGGRVQRNLRLRHVASRPSSAAPQAYAPARAVLV